MRRKSIIPLPKIRKRSSSSGEKTHFPSLLEDKHSATRQSAAEALGNIGDVKAVDALSKALLKDKDKDVRRKSAQALEEIGDRKAVEALNQRLQTETHKDVIKTVSYALKSLGADKAVPLEIQIEMLREKQDWKTLKPLLKEQETVYLIEQLQSKDKLIRGMVAEILMERTDKFDLGTDYSAWKNWYEASKK